MSEPVLFPTQEIGSLARPLWQLEAQRRGPLSARARAEFVRWNQQLGFADASDPDVAAFAAGSSASGTAVSKVRDWGAAFGLRFLESAGLDRVYDGEARRVEMYEHAVRRAKGFELLGHVRSFDNKYYRKARVTGEVGIEEPYDLDEFEFVRVHARATPKFPITGPYTLVDWSFDEHYLRRQGTWRGREARERARREFAVDVARKVVRPTLAALIDRGCRVVQIDEPAAGTHPREGALVAEAFNAATDGLDAEFSMHICFSDYRSLFPALLETKNCRQWAWEFANRDTEQHDGYAVLSLLKEYGDPRQVGLGVLDVHRDEVESPAIVQDRIERAVRVLGDPSRIWVNPDCGLRTRSLDVAYAKLTSMVEGARRARRAVG